MRLRFVPSQRLVTGVLLLIPALVVGLVVLVIYLYVDTQDRLEASENRVAASETTTAALADQLRSMGVEPTVDVDDVTEGTPVLVPGPPGEPGGDGRDGIDGARGVQGQRGLPGIGRPGPPGPAGRNGADGRTVVGPAGPTGPPGPQGEPGVGQQGPAGEPGKDGSDGAPGTATPGTYTCPDGTRVAGLTVAADGGVTLDCRGPLDP